MTRSSNTTKPTKVGARHLSNAMRHEASAPQSVVKGADAFVSVKPNQRFRYGYDVGGAKTTFELAFRTSSGRRILVEVDSPDLMKPQRVIEKVVSEQGIFPADVVKLKQQIEGCIDARVPVVERTTITGWRAIGKSRAFVTPADSFGPGRAGFQFASSLDHLGSGGEVGTVKGDLKTWQEEVGQYLEMSNVGRVLLGAALASPLLGAADLTESWILLLAGRTTSGKSTLLKGAASFQGAADPVSPRTSDRRFNELAAKHNDLLFVVGDLSQLNKTDRRRVLHWLAMDATAGQPRSVSRAVRATLPDLRFRTIAALSAEQTSVEIAQSAGVMRLAGEAVRCFDLVPGAKGYFDSRPSKGRLPPEVIAERINEGAALNHGSGLKAWIEWLALRSEAQIRSDVQSLMDEFVEMLDHNGRLDGIDRRSARKFGLIYAGLVLGQRAGVTALSSKRAFKSVRKCFVSATAPDRAVSPEEAVAKLRRALKAPGTILRTFQGAAVVKRAATENPDWLCVDTQRQGKRAIGLRPGPIRRAVGECVAQTAFDALIEQGVLDAPSGTARWQKKIPGSGKVRLLALNPSWLDQA